MKEVTWSLGGSVLFVIKKKYRSPGNLPGAALLWPSTHSEKKKGRAFLALPLRLLSFDESGRER